MDQNSIRKTLKVFAKNLTKQIRVNELIVFGSYGANAATKESDLDLVVVSDEFENLNEEMRFDIVYRASRYLEPEIHPWPSTSKEIQSASSFSLLGRARRKGVTVPLDFL